MAGYIDIVCNLFTPFEVENGMTGLDDDFKAQVRMPEAMRGGVEIDDYLLMMDRAGIERSLLIAVRAGQPGLPQSFEVPYERVAEVCKAYPDRFSGLAGIDPTRGVDQLGELNMAVNDFGFVGAHYYPHWFGLAPDDQTLYPIYSRCLELDIPIMMQVGQNLVYSRDLRLPSVANPMTFDQVACDFPALKLIGIHLGVPWMDEMIAMAWKHANVFIGGDAYAPKHWPASFVHYANSYGQDKCLFGTDWPVISPERAVAEVTDLGFKENAKNKLMRENAKALFKLS